MTARSFLLIIPILIVSSITALCSSAEARYRNSGKFKVQKIRQTAGNKVKKWYAAQFSQAEKKPVAPMEEEYLRFEIEPEQNRVLENALGLLGVKYRFGGSDLSGIDCSAFVRKVFSCLNLSLPRTAREQFQLGEGVPLENLQKGDLVFFQTYARFPSHVGIYLGDDRMIHASSSGGKVMISNIYSSYFRSRYLGARRVPLEDPSLAELIQEAGAPA